MTIFYHGSFALFKQFDASYILNGVGKIKFGYGIYLTSNYETAAHYSAKNNVQSTFYVYTVQVPDLSETNYIAFRRRVNPLIITKAEEKLGVAILDKVASDGKLFRKYLVKTLYGKSGLEGERIASEFLLSIGVEMIVWPYSWVNPDKGINCAVLDESKIQILKIEQVELNEKGQLIENSQRTVVV